jgi:hypothetical protein
MLKTLLVILFAAAAAFAADINGKWTASFETPIGTQNYTYTFQVSGDQLTGTAKSDNGESKILEGKVSGDDVTFVEILKFQDMEIRCVYKGKASGDQIKFARQVGDFGGEEFTAKRAK